MDGLASVRTIRVKAETSDGPAVSPSSNLVGGKTNERSEPGISSPAAANNYREQSAPRREAITLRHRPVRYRRGVCPVAQRLPPDRIVDYTMDKMESSPIKPPPDKMAETKDGMLQAMKQPIQRVETAAKSFVGIFVFVCLASALCLLGVLAFGGRMNFWQAFAAVLYFYMPVAVISKLVSLVILFIKAPDDIHPLIVQETLLTDNLGILFKPADHPVLFVLGSAIGVLSFYGLWLKAKGLANAGQKVSSTAAC